MPLTDPRSAGTPLPADSAGIPWAGRHFESNPLPDDDGSAPRQLLEVLARFHAGDASAREVVDILRFTRLLVPLVAEVDGAPGHQRADLSIVTVAGPDGRAVLPVFSSSDSMRRWNAAARPIPVDPVRVALAAVDDRTDLAVLDPTSDTEFAIRRPALWAIARQVEWVPGYADPHVLAEFEASIVPEPDVVAIRVSSGDPTAHLDAAEVLVTLALRSGLDEATLATLVGRLHAEWSRSPLIAERVDSLAIQLSAAEDLRFS